MWYDVKLKYIIFLRFLFEIWPTESVIVFKNRNILSLDNSNSDWDWNYDIKIIKYLNTAVFVYRYSNIEWKQSLKENDALEDFDLGPALHYSSITDVRYLFGGWNIRIIAFKIYSPNIKITETFVYLNT